MVENGRTGLSHYMPNSVITLDQRNDRALLLFSDLPFWLVTDKRDASRIENIFRRLENWPNDTMGRWEKAAVLAEVMGIDLQLIKGKKIKENGDNRLLSIGVNITSRCNLKCPHCYVEKAANSESELTLSEIYRLLEEAKGLAYQDCSVQFTGGEPLLRPMVLCESLRAAREIGFNNITMNTNALLVTEELADALAQLTPTNITISLDGVTRECHEAIRGSGTFQRTMLGIKLLTDRSLPLTLSMTVHQGNFHEIEDFIRLCASLEAIAFISPLAPIGRAAINRSLKHVPLDRFLLKLYSIYRDNPQCRHSMGGTFLATVIQSLRNTNRRPYCGSGLSTLFVDSNGDIFPCVNTLYIDELLLSNVRDQPLSHILSNSPVLQRLRALSVETMNRRCARCPLRFICAGFCRGITCKVTGNLRAPFIWCEEFYRCLIEGMWIIAETPDIFEHEAHNEAELNRRLC